MIAVAHPVGLELLIVSPESRSELGPLVPQPTRARSAAERRRAFFYAELQAPYYDAAADLNTPLFTLMQKTLFDLVRLHRAGVPPAEAERVFVVLDIGSGTGVESLPILRAFPSSRIVAFDLCEPMHDEFRRKACEEFGEAEVAARCQFVTGDIAEDAGATLALSDYSAKWVPTRQYDIVISSLTLHHLTTAEKRSVSQRVASVLAPGGLFLNGDIFSYSSASMAKAANDFGIEWIRRNFSDPPAELRKLKEALGDQAGPMGEAWVDHYVNYNLPDPIDSLGRSGAAGDPKNDQAQMLIDAGFSEVAVPFRFWEVGILWAKK